MSIFVTGGTGYLGSYVVSELLRTSATRLALLTRARDRRQGIEKLWQALQLHMEADELREFLPRIDLVRGDLEAPSLGLDARSVDRLAESTDSVLHIAASLNRKSEKACLNANLRGTLSVVQLTRTIAERRGGLRRISTVSTTAVAGRREHACVDEDTAIDWGRSDYDPYARTKKFAEHLVRELLPDLEKTIFRPPTVMGDSRRKETTQFEMLRIYGLLIASPVVPVHPDTRLDFVPADFVGKAIAAIHLKDAPRYDTYHLSAGLGSKTASEHQQVLRAAGIRTPRLVPSLHGAFDRVAGALAGTPRGQLSLIGSLVKVFLPYFTNDVVFDNRRVVEELGISPTPFTDYVVDLLTWARKNQYRYDYVPLPAGLDTASSNQIGATL